VDDLTPVREKLFQGAVTPGVARDCVKACRTETLHQECAAAVEEVFRYVHAGARFRDISVVCTDMGAYRDTVEMLFRRSNIPVYISGTEDILEKSVVTTVLAAMDAALGGFEQQDVLRYFKSALSPLDMESCDRLEDYAVRWSVTGSRWLKPWTAHPDGLGQQENADERLAALNANREKGIAPLEKLHKAFRSAGRVKDQVLAIYNFFTDIALGERLGALAKELDSEGDNRSAQILDQLWNILVTALEQLYDVLGDTVWDGESFTRLFKLLLSQYDVGTIPHVLDAVTVGPVTAMRTQQCSHLLLLGATEGNLPSYGSSSGVLTDQERTALRQMGVPLTGGAMEGLQAEFAEIYGVFCSAEKSVWISCSDAQPAVVFRRLADMAGGEQEPSWQLGAALGDAVEASALLVRSADAQTAQQLQLGELYKNVKQKTEHVLGEVSPENIRKLYGNRLNMSASQIDRQAQCRLSYFLSYGLRAEERKPITVDPAEFGSYVHAVLENTAREIMSMGGFREVSAEKTLEIAKKHSEEYAKERFSELDSERLNYLFSRNSYELELIVLELWKEMQECLFAPVGFEVGFGDGKQIPAIDISGQLMQARLRGYVDRVDAWEDGGRSYFRVVDYKTGKKDFDYCDVYNGYGLQMLLYMFALEEGGESLLSGERVGAGVQYFPARVPIVPADGILTEEEAEKLRVKHWKRKGLLLSQEQVLEAMEALDPPLRMPYSRKKDGTISGNLADRGQLAMLKTYVFALVAGMVDEIASGKVEPNPYTRGSAHDACAWCPYAAVCHKQDVEGRRNYKAVSSDRFWSDVESAVKNNG
jgi:ATP-dependent helicase/nuclease subunit B